MPPKPHRVLLDRVSGYADEAAAYMRRRRLTRRPFARLYYAERPQRRPRRDRAAGAELFVAAGRLIEVAGKRPKAMSELLDPARRRARARPRSGQRRPLRRGLRRTAPRARDGDRRVADRGGAVRRRGGRRGAGRRRRHHLLRPRRRARSGRPRARRRRGRGSAARRAARAAAAAGARGDAAADRAPPG